MLINQGDQIEIVIKLPIDVNMYTVSYSVILILQFDGLSVLYNYIEKGEKKIKQLV